MTSEVKEPGYRTSWSLSMPCKTGVFYPGTPAHLIVGCCLLLGQLNKETLRLTYLFSDCSVLLR